MGRMTSSMLDSCLIITILEKENLKMVVPFLNHDGDQMQREL